jgi:hypothetical protein
MSVFARGRRPAKPKGSVEVGTDEATNAVRSDAAVAGSQQGIPKFSRLTRWSTATKVSGSS